VKTNNRDFSRLYSTLDSLEKNIVSKSSARAINRVSDISKSRTTKEIAAKLNVKQKLVRRRLYIKRANSRKLQSLITFYVNDIPVISLGEKSARGSNNIITGKVLSKRTGRRRSQLPGVKIGGRFFHNAFINTVRSSGKPHILRRKGKPRTPIEVVTLPLRKASAGVLIRNVNKAVEQHLSNEFEKDFNHRLNKALNK
jgi:Prophage minor tail protein Z (GPZ)